MSNFMKAAVIEAPGRAATAKVAIPSPGPGELLIRVEGCGVCASELPRWQGRPWFEYPAPPGAPGHEGWGYVEEAGAGVEDFVPGERVILLSGCCYSEYQAVPVNSVLKLSRSLDRYPFPGEPVGCAANAVRRSRILPGETVAVLGGGFLGILFCRLAAGSGARIVLFSRRQCALDLAGTGAAVEAVLLEDHRLARQQASELFGALGCDVVVEATGHQEPLDLAGEMVREGGRLVIAGYHQDGLRKVNMQLWNWKGIDVINAHERSPAVQMEGMSLGMEAAKAGKLDIPSLISHRFRLEELGQAYRMLSRRPEGFIKAIIAME